MKRIITTIAVLAVSVAFVATAQAGKKPDAAAGDKKKADPEEQFKKLDKDNDGSISKDEFTAHGKDKAKAEAAFAKKDKNGDGKLSKEEFAGKKNK